MRGLPTLALTAAALAAAPGAALAADRDVYSVVKASGTERLTFTADPRTCAEFATCGERGTVVYRFGGKPRGRLVLTTSRRGRVEGGASFRSAGRTEARVTAADGTTCTDSVRHRSETFSLDSGRGLRRLLFILHPRPTRHDYLRTECAGPSEANLARAGTLPEATFKRRDFSFPRTSFRATGDAFFRDRGYRGTVRWTLGYRVVRR